MKFIVEMEIDVDISDGCKMKLSEIKKNIKSQIKSGCYSAGSLGHYHWQGYNNIKLREVDK